MPYDPNSGLVFSETVVKQSRKEFYRIKRQTKSLGARVEYVPPEHGPATLVELSMLTILRSLGMLDDNSLSTVPPFVGDDMEVYRTLVSAMKRTSSACKC
jgi:hypothetical protein